MNNKKGRYKFGQKEKQIEVWIQRRIDRCMDRQNNKQIERILDRGIAR